MKHLTLMAIISMLLLSACKKDRLTANGEQITETRAMNEFHSLKIEGASDIHVTYGNEYKVVIKGSSNLIPYFKTNIVNRNLIVGYENANVKSDDIEVYITMPLLKNASLSGSGDMEITGAFVPINALDLSLSGSGDIAIVNELMIDQLYVSISGSGEMSLQKAISKNAEINITGSGDAKVQVSDFLKARISGSGEIYYKGNPLIDSKISGSGRLIKF